MPENIVQIPEPERERSDAPRPRETSESAPGLTQRVRSARLRHRADAARKKYRAIQMELRRARWQVRDSWYHLTNGLELNELWAQFKHEAHVSTRLYKQDASLRELPTKKSWKQPFRVAAALFLAILSKLSPARRVFLLATLIVAVLAAVGFEFLFVTKQVEFVLAFGGLLLLLLLVLGDHVTMKRDIEIAREIQRLLVPRVAPEIPGVDMAFSMRPANMVGGDYYDAFRREIDGPLLLAVADVAGKSVPAAMMMANFQASLRALAGARSSLSELVTDLNRLVCANNLSGRRFTTAFLAELNPATGRLAYLCAGHNPPILLRGNGEVERLQSESMPLGIELTEKYAAGETVMEPYDALVIYTDGITEALSVRREPFGEARLIAALQPRQSEERASVTLARILNKLDEFTGRADQHDDITCLVVSRFSASNS
ncbi:MAG: PP2C family protein-serine/threonine phosphatase [Acidobacteriota bacterium]|nr:PP2C family protein-serine/threonine phosphatase [Acidobacteriota bacterium]